MRRTATSFSNAKRILPDCPTPFAPARRRPFIALDGFGRAHYFLLLGIVLTAAGLKAATGHPYDDHYVDGTSARNYSVMTTAYLFF